MSKPETITFIAGVARSGTSWLGQIFNSSPDVAFRFQPLFSYEFQGQINVESAGVEFESVLKSLFETETPFLIQAEKTAKGEYPSFKKAEKQRHLVFKENRYQYLIEPMLRKCPQVKLIGIIRNPCAVLNSWMKNPKEFPIGSDPLNEWRYGDCKNSGHQDFFGYYKWKEISHLYLDLKDKWPNRVYVIKYEELVKDPVTETCKMFDFCEIPMSEITLNFLQESSESHNQSYYSVYKDKSVADKWREELNPYIISEIEADLKDTRLDQFYFS